MRDCIRCQSAKIPREAIGKRCCLWRKSAGFKHHTRMGLPRQPRQLLGIIPDQTEEFIDLMHEASRGLAASPMFQR